MAARIWEASALERLEAAAKIDATNAGVLAALGRLHMQKGNHQKAMQRYRALLLQSFDEKQAGLTKADVYLALGQIHLALGEKPKARGMLERANETSPGRDDIKALLAQVE
jgi:tetratricopeptide (TPR) repeat protein